jgi:hypothetical protein
MKDDDQVELRNFPLHHLVARALTRVQSDRQIANKPRSPPK